MINPGWSTSPAADIAQSEVMKYDSFVSLSIGVLSNRVETITFWDLDRPDFEAPNLVSSRFRMRRGEIDAISASSSILK
jgi:hypothetical protein